MTSLLIPKFDAETETTGAASEIATTGDRCITVVFNPVSGQTNPDVRRRAIEQALAEYGYRCQHLVTTPEHGARYHAEQALKNGADMIAVSGGDGTIMEVLAVLVGTGVPVAIFPAGTGNLLSINLGLPKAIPGAVEAALTGTRRKVDLARIVEKDGVALETPQYFSILAGAGYDASIIRDADRKIKDRLGLGAYFWAALKNLKRRPVAVRVALDDGKTQTWRRAKSVMVANMGMLQGNVPLIPDASPDDGLLDVAVLKAENLKEWCSLAFNLLRRRLRDDPAVDFMQTRRVQVILSRSQPMQFDGEELDGRWRSFVVEIVPEAVEIMVPRDPPV